MEVHKLEAQCIINSIVWSLFCKHNLCTCVIANVTVLILLHAIIYWAYLLYGYLCWVIIC